MVSALLAAQNARTTLAATAFAESRNSNIDNSGVVSGCLLPGVVPEIRNKLVPFGFAQGRL
jgi:hypothetical protein